MPGVLWLQESSRMEALPKPLALTKLRGVLMSLDLKSSTNVVVHVCDDLLKLLLPSQLATNTPVTSAP